MDFNDIISEKSQRVQEIVYRYLPKEEGFQKNIIEAMNYSVQAGGKRLRPLLMSEFYKLFNENDANYDALCHFMAAIEMIHTYSLVHDDLPAMDDDEYRRGRKTTHVVYGYAAAILAGDGLLNYAYEVAADSFNDRNDTYAVAMAMKILASRPGVYGMLGGQSVDIENDNKSLDIDTLNFIYDLKTGALIECSMLIGAVLAGIKDDRLDIIKRMAHCIGRAFQIQDDILDVTADMSVLGKPAGSDDKNNKTTYITLYGVERASDIVSEYSGEAVELLNSLTGGNGDVKEFIEKLILFLVKRKS